MKNAQEINNDFSVMKVLTNSMKKKLPIKYAGFNALELMMVLAVIAIGIGVAIRTMSGNSNKQNTNQMVSDITALVSNIKNSYTSSTSGYTNLTTTSAIQGALIPSDLKVPTGGTTVQNQFQGGTVDIASANNGEAFSITYSNVPSAICNSVITSLGASSFVSITVNGTSVYDAVTDPTIDATAISTACNTATNSLVFTAS
jgi:Tfp pilus assembly protein PilE